MKKNLFLLGLCAALYWLVRLWLRHVTTGAVQWFLVCYFSDILAGLVLPAVTGILLLLSGRTALCKWPPIALLLLAAGLVWECLAPLWKPGAVFDWWDFTAYQLGGLLYWLFSRCNFHQTTTEN